MGSAKAGFHYYAWNASLSKQHVKKGNRMPQAIVGVYETRWWWEFDQTLSPWESLAHETEEHTYAATELFRAGISVRHWQPIRLFCQLQTQPVSEDDPKNVSSYCGQENLSPSGKIMLADP